MALPWGSHSSLPVIPGGLRVDVAALAVPNASDPIASFRRMLSRASAALPLVDGSYSAPPCTAYEIEVKVDTAPTDGVYVCRGSIDGHEINEQLILRGSARTAAWG